MNFKQVDIDKFLKEPDKNVRCVLLYGSNEGMIAEFSQKFALTACDDLTDAFRVTTFQTDALEKDISALYADYNATSMMGGRRVILIKEANNNLTKHIKELLENSVSDTLIVMSSLSVNTKSSLVTYLNASPVGIACGCYEDRAENITSYVRSFFIQNKVTISSDAIELLCARLSPDRKVSLNELEKLMTYIGFKRNVTIEDVQKVVSDASGNSIEDLSYFVALGQAEQAVNTYESLLNGGEEPVMLLRNLAYHFLKILECVAQMEKGNTADMALSSLRPPLMFYRKSDFLLQLKIWKRQPLLDVLSLLYKAERDCKTTDYPAREIGSYTMLQISGAARKLKSV